MQCLTVNGTALHVRTDGPQDGPALVFSNSLGSDFRIWDKVLPLLPPLSIANKRLISVPGAMLAVLFFFASELNRLPGRFSAPSFVSMMKPPNANL